MLGLPSVLLFSHTMFLLLSLVLLDLALFPTLHNQLLLNRAVGVRLLAVPLINCKQTLFGDRLEVYDHSLLSTLYIAPLSK